jgi:hypothetical protein
MRESVARLRVALLTVTLVAGLAHRAAAQPATTRRPAAPICLHFRYSPSRNRDAEFFPSGVQFSDSDSLVHFWWDARSPDIAQLQKQTRGLGHWRRLGRDSIWAIVYSSLNESYMGLVFVVAPDRHSAAISTHSAEDPTVVAVSSRVNCRTHQAPERRAPQAKKS